MSEELDKDLELNEEETATVIVLTDEEGNDVAFEFLDLIEYEGDDYVILSPAGEDEEEGDESEVVILRLEETDEENGGETYVAFDDEEVMFAVYEIFKEKFKNTFTFNDAE